MTGVTVMLSILIDAILTLFFGFLLLMLLIVIVLLPLYIWSKQNDKQLRRKLKLPNEPEN